MKMPRLWRFTLWAAALRPTPAVWCDYTEDEFDCPRRGTRIGVLHTDPPVRIPLCRRHGRRKHRVGWTVHRAGRTELLELAAPSRISGDEGAPG